jgi:hypothetical protein
MENGGNYRKAATVCASATALAVVFGVGAILTTHLPGMAGVSAMFMMRPVFQAVGDSEPHRTSAIGVGVGVTFVTALAVYVPLVFFLGRGWAMLPAFVVAGWVGAFTAVASTRRHPVRAPKAGG